MLYKYTYKHIWKAYEQPYKTHIKAYEKPPGGRRLFIWFYFLQRPKKRNLEEVDEVQDRHGEIFEMEK